MHKHTHTKFSQRSSPPGGKTEPPPIKFGVLKKKKKDFYFQQKVEMFCPRGLGFIGVSARPLSLRQMLAWGGRLDQDDHTLSSFFSRLAGALQGKVAKIF